ncbi:acetyltransferase [Paenibacillus vietnamensis]|uniref:acetyltransferase n=1 Tax=Paenibacillus vietnamensis TaxID=2590547 RepID=UPI001CD15C21|nr:acetyltransferase [Paenibacillus vietnamensis]
MNSRIVVFGAGGHAKAVIDTIEKEGRYLIAGLLDGYQPEGSSFYGYKILGSEQWLAANAGQIDGCIVAVGDNWLRSRMAEAIRSVAPDIPFVSTVHPAASVARGAVLGAGSVVMAGSVVGSDTRLGEHNVLYTLSSVDHDGRTGSFVTLAPHAATGGNVTISDYSVLSIRSAVIHGITVGEHSVIGAGSTVLADIPSHSVAYGTPAKVIRSRTVGERYL